MTATYTDVLDAMIRAESQEAEINKVVLDSESMESFLIDDNFTKEDEIRQKETIGGEWELAIESGDDNYLLLENGSKIQL